MARRRSKTGKFDLNSFYCIQCGERVFDIPRPQNLRRGQHHRKRLYCWHCKAETNTCECRSFEEVELFKQQFENGTFKEEAQESLNFCCKGV